MRALTVAAAGEPAALSDIPIPEVAPGTVRIQVRAASLNGIDKSIAFGMMAGMMEHAYPVTVGRDAAGIVDAVGADVTDVAVRDEVIGHIMLSAPLHEGTIAEYAVLSAETVTRKPAGLNFESAAALPLAGAAAVQAVDAIDAQAGQTVLVVGASGGVGSYAVQLLAASGVTVIATGLPDDTERLTDLGAAQVLDYRAGSVADEVLSAHPDGVDALIDLVSYGSDDLLANAAAVRKGGRVSTTLGGADDEALSSRGLKGATVMAVPVRDIVTRLAEQAASGALRVDIEQVVPLEEAATGLQNLGSGHVRGKIVVRVQE